MTPEELREAMESIVKEQLTPVLEKQKEQDEKQKQFEETNRKYAGIFDQQEKSKETKNEPGITFTRATKCLMLAKNDPEKALWFAEKGVSNGKEGMYPEDKEVKEMLKALSVTTPSEGGFLVPENYSRDIIPLLRSKIAIMQLGVRRVPMAGGNMNIPKQTGGATSYYVGENQDATKSQPTFGNVKLSSKKLITLVPISNDLIRNASIEADMLVRDDMIQTMALKVDYTAMYGSGTEFTPRGIKTVLIKEATASITVATGATTLTGDIPGSMIAALMANNAPMISVGWAFNSKIWNAFYNLKTTTNQYIYRDEMNRGTLNGFPFKVTNQITTANSTAGTTYFDIFLGDFSEFLFGEEIAFELDASREASWSDGSTLQSAFSLDQTVLKVTQKHDMNLRHPESFLCWNYPSA